MSLIRRLRDIFVPKSSLCLVQPAVAGPLTPRSAFTSVSGVNHRRQANIRHAKAAAERPQMMGLSEVRRPRVSILFMGTCRLNKKGDIVVARLVRFGMFMRVEWIGYDFELPQGTLIAVVGE